jgi:membrane-bound lytic murein transglycosylase D
MRGLLFILCLLGIQLTSFSQTRTPKPTIKHPMDSEAYLKMLDETLMDYYSSVANDKKVDSLIDALEMDSDNIGDISDDEYCVRLEKINALSPFHLDCNDITLGMIKFFVKNRRGFAKIVLGRSKLYFDLYEQTLAKYDMPIELKYLSVIESGLRPQVKSPAGALGLWQFMYGTGKMYGLTENSYIDDRMDPVKATEAACKFLNKLYGIYGDWNLALAAYNAGPGNVNKAIRRSGGKRTYWEVRPFLPRETQGYVPNFIAAAYLLTYHKEHNIKPAAAKNTFYQLDTICLSKGVHMSTIEKLTAWSEDEVAALNPIYKTRYIPGTDPKQCITGPFSEIGKLVSFGDSLYNLEKSIYAPKPKPVEVVDTSKLVLDSNGVVLKTPVEVKPIVNAKPTTIWHRVARGETLHSISVKYEVTIEEIKKWNYLRNNTAPLGRNLKIIKTNNPTVAVTPTIVIPEKPIESVKPTPKPIEKIKEKEVEIIETKPIVEVPAKPVVFDSVVTIFHTVARNESIEAIAERYNVTLENIKTWNGLTSSWVNIDQKLKILINVKLFQPELGGKQKPVERVKPMEKKRFYTVKPGDMFIRIAENHSLTPEELHELNPKTDPNTIRVGEILRVK